MRIAIIGGGASGCFAAINIKRRLPEAEVTVYESGKKLLAKVAVTGGGRCNLTNSFENVRNIGDVYPRGAILMKRLLKEFDNKETCKWFENEGVRLVTQKDKCVFPKSQNAMEIVSTLTKLMFKHNVVTRTGYRANEIRFEEKKSGDGKISKTYRISFTNNTHIHADIVLVTTGGSPKPCGLDMFKTLELDIAKPVPSLFSFCLSDHGINELTGTVVNNVTVGIAGTRLRATGPLLITHQGMSGPAILKLSAHAARLLNERGYKAQMIVNWLGTKNERETADMIDTMAVNNKQKQMANVYPEQLNSRLWNNLLIQSKLNPEQRWKDLGRTGVNKLAAILTGNIYNVKGKNRFKDEFVTCGGIALNNINPALLECKKHSGLYFAGEVLDVDGVTGGFNLQAAWTMGYVAAKSIAGKSKNNIQKTT